jgi:hypothetical protein
MKTLPTEALDALDGRELIHAAAVKFAFEEPIRLWSGYGNLEINSEIYEGAGAAALITPTSSSIGGANDGLTIDVSGLDPATAQLTEDTDYHQKPITIYRLIFAPDTRTLLGATAFLRGRVDSIVITETIGEQSSLQIQVEGPRRDMNRSGSRLRSDTDQRALGGDAGLKHVGTASRKTLTWGNKPATAGNVIPAGTTVNGVTIRRPLFL